VGSKERNTYADTKLRRKITIGEARVLTEPVKLVARTTLQSNTRPAQKALPKLSYVPLLLPLSAKVVAVTNAVQLLVCQAVCL
jgi:hypothetical protein